MRYDHEAGTARCPFGRPRLTVSAPWPITSHRLDIPRRFLSPAAAEEEEWAVAVTSNARTQPEYQYVRQF